MPTRILLVNADPVALRGIDAHLSDEGYWVAAVSSFQLAKQLLLSVGRDLLVADVRLEAFSGLHLAARSRLDHPRLPVIITHTSYDPALEAQTQRLGEHSSIRSRDASLRQDCHQTLQARAYFLSTWTYPRLMTRCDLTAVCSKLLRCPAGVELR